MPHVSEIDPLKYRQADAEILDLFVRRWSPRAMSGEALNDDEFNRLLEAARWAPSSYNEQPWRIIYARRGTEHWPTFIDLLMETNQAWCHQAAILLLIVSKKTFTKTGKPNKVHTFDAGSWWTHLALQGTAMGLVTHGMAGFNNGKARAVLGVPDDYDCEAMVAIGKPGRVEDLPEKLREMEKPSPRRPVAQTIMEGRFRA
ncbi:MAG: nitroreductase family protein [Phycisphaeraceae bacterium]